jgi:copper homeostasis protein
MGRYIQIEVCANSLDSALQAQEGGAVRIELCDNLYEGGTTPALSLVKKCRELLNISLNVLIRPRPGDFCYSSHEFGMMLDDIARMKDFGVDGVVIGALNMDGTIDRKGSERLIRAASGMSVTFHRAFDLCVDLMAEFPKLQDLGVNRLLSSGGANKAIDGWNTLAELVELSDHLPVIMPGSGVNEDNIQFLVEKTGAVEFHVSLRNPVQSAMTFRKAEVLMGSIPDYNEYSRMITSAERVRKVIELANHHPVRE